MTRTITHPLPQPKQPLTFTIPESPKTHVEDPATLLVTLVHEIRNPVTNINLAVELLNKMTPDANQKLYLEIIQRASDNIKQLVNTLVRSTQEKNLALSFFSVHDLLDEVLLMTEDRIQLKKIRVTKQFAPTDHFKLTDKAGMKIALTNIIINAIDATEEQGELSITTEFLEGRFTLQIADNGCGMSAERLEHIFEPFYTGKVNGLGIGLSATLAILKINKVLVKVTSEEGIGTCFLLSFAKGL